MESDGRHLNPHPFRAIFSGPAPVVTKPPPVPQDITHVLQEAGDRVIAERVRVAKDNETVSQSKPEVKRMANTGAKGFAAIMKANVEKMNKAFSDLADEMNGEFKAMEGHLATGKEQVAAFKSDNAELREAFGLANDTGKT